MKTISDVLVDLDRTFKADPRPCCFHCLSVVSQELSYGVEKHIRENLSMTYIVEDGTCKRRDHQGRVIRLRNIR